MVKKSAFGPVPTDRACQRGNVLLGGNIFQKEVFKRKLNKTFSFHIYWQPQLFFCSSPPQPDICHFNRSVQIQQVIVWFLY